MLDRIFFLSLPQISPSVIYLIYFSSWFFSVCLFSPSTSRKEQEGVSWFITGLIFPGPQFSTIRSISFMIYGRCIVLGAFAKSKKATISFVISVRPSVLTSVQTELCTQRDGFEWNSIFEYFSKICQEDSSLINPYPTAFPYGNGMVLHFYQQQESSTTKTVHKVINKGLKTYV